MNFRLYMLQRLTAVVMVPLVVGHIAMIFYATRKGVSATEIVSRTRGSLFWGAYYVTFVLAAAIHGAIGVRTVLHEWVGARAGLTDRSLDIAMWLAGLVLAALGLRAVYALVG